MVGLIECTEFDDDCSDVKDKWKCWNHSPENGFCPYLQSNIDIIRKRRGKSVSLSSGYEEIVKRILDRVSKLKNLKPGQPCDHPGCCSHITHPCEICGRTKCGLG